MSEQPWTSPARIARYLRDVVPTAIDVRPVDDRVEITLPAGTSDDDLDRVVSEIQALKPTVRVGVSRADGNLQGSER